MMKFYKETGNIQGCHPERREGSPVSTHESPGDTDPSRRSG